MIDVVQKLKPNKKEKESLPGKNHTCPEAAKVREGLKGKALWPYVIAHCWDKPKAQGRGVEG